MSRRFDGMLRARTFFEPLLGVIALVAAGGCAQRDTSAGSWPQWRGPQGTGISEAVGLPESWSATEGIRWGVKLPGSGISSPIVGHEVVYVTAGEGRRIKSLVLIALDLKTGERLWKTEVAKRAKERLHRLNRAAAATPATNGEAIFVYFGSHLGAVSTDGELLWAREIYSEYLEHSHYGAGSSLVLTENAVIVFRDREDVGDTRGWLAAFSQETGEELWRNDWNDSCCSYTTPLKIDFAQQPELVIAHAGRVVSYEPRTGAQLWERSVQMWQPVASPVVEGDLLCVASGAHGKREMGCWRLRIKENRRRIRNLWRGSKAVPGTASPLLYKGLFFTVHEKGFAKSYNAKTGRELWRARLGHGSYRASPVLGDGKIYAVSYRGMVSVFSAKPKFELLSVNPLPEGGVVASPAIADGCLIVRTNEYLYCVEGKQAATITAS